MTKAQRLFYDQAKSDYEMFLHLGGKPECHRLHFLQMAVEKLSKAYYFHQRTSLTKSHKAFVGFVRKLSDKSTACKALGFRQKRRMRAYVNSILPLAYEVECLAPALAGDGPNPEYPWPRDMPTEAPVHYSFPVWSRLQDAHGKKLLDFLGKIMQSFPQWC